MFLFLCFRLAESCGCATSKVPRVLLQGAARCALAISGTVGELARCCCLRANPLVYLRWAVRPAAVYALFSQVPCGSLLQGICRRALTASLRFTSTQTSTGATESRSPGFS